MEFKFSIEDIECMLNAIGVRENELGKDERTARLVESINAQLNRQGYENNEVLGIVKIRD